MQLYFYCTYFPQEYLAAIILKKYLCLLLARVKVRFNILKHKKPWKYQEQTGLRIKNNNHKAFSAYILKLRYRFLLKYKNIIFVKALWENPKFHLWLAFCFKGPFIRQTTQNYRRLRKYDPTKQWTCEFIGDLLSLHCWWSVRHGQEYCPSGRAVSQSVLTLTCKGNFWLGFTI